MKLKSTAGKITVGTILVREIYNKFYAVGSDYGPTTFERRHPLTIPLTNEEADEVEEFSKVARMDGKIDEGGSDGYKGYDFWFVCDIDKDGRPTIANMGYFYYRFMYDFFLENKDVTPPDPLLNFS